MGKTIWITVRRFRVVFALLMLSALPLVLALQPGAALPPGTEGNSGQAADDRQKASKANLPRPNNEQSVPSVAVTRLTPQRIIEYRESTAEIRPAATVDIYSDTSGVIVEMKVCTGSRVEREEIIGTVDQSLPGRPYLPTPIRVSMSGTVVSNVPQPGTKVSVHEPVLRIATTDRLEIVTHIPERYIDKVARGTRAMVRVEAYPDSAPSGAVVRELSPTVDPRSRTLEALLEFERPELLPVGVRPGMFARLHLLTGDSPQALVVPQSAVLRRSGKPFVYVLNRLTGVAELREVSLGIESNGQAELVNGVMAGEEVVVRGQHMLPDTAAVRVVETVIGTNGGT